MRPMRFINEKRIERAMHIMATGTATNSEIATLTGFESLAYFTRTFKRIAGSTPSTYRHRLT